MTVTRNVPFSPPDISETEIQGVVEALDQEQKNLKEELQNSVARIKQYA